MPGHPYFITAVTYHRARLLVDHGDLLLQAMEEISHRCQCTHSSWVILPDHFHAIIDPEGNDISNLLQRVKMSFGVLLRKRWGTVSGRVWQSRFWDHAIRDDNDMRRHIDYIHYNPVKHGYVMRPFDWQYSSIHEFRSYYSEDWGERAPVQGDREYGE
jgi:putative transposase